MTDIHIVGLGVSSVYQVTREAEAAIGRSRDVLYLDTGVATRAYLESLCPRVTSLYDESYRERRPRLDAYHHMAARVVDAAMDHGPVTFAVHGHPLVAVYPTFLVCDVAEVLGLEVSVAPGISAFDSIAAELCFDPCAEGIQMYEATDAMLRRRPLQADVPALLWQVGNLETRLHTTRASKPERFHRLLGYLRQFYPGQHEVIAVYTSPHPLVPAAVIRCPLERLPAEAGRIHPGFSLYIPAVNRRAVADAELLALIDSADHLDSLVEDD